MTSTEGSSPIGAETVDVALVLAADCSGSVSNEDLALQLRGYAEAVASEQVLRAVRAGRHGQIALTFMSWSGVGMHDQLVPWRLIDGIDAAREFSTALLGAPHPMPGFTSLSGAIDFGVMLLKRCRFPAAEQVIDLSGDGLNNDGRLVTAARDDAVAAGVRINGLPIVRRGEDIVAYYAENVIGGVAAFLVVANEMASFREAVVRKLVAEIAAAPVSAVAG